MGYETSDVNIKGVRVTAIAFTSLITGTMIVVGLWYWLLGPGSRPVPGMLGNRQLPLKANKNNPLLQDSVTSKTDIMTLRREETKMLETTGYVDPSKTTVHIPIERAMEIVASGRYISTGTNLPARAPAPRTSGGERTQKP
jgi:hypothetical protein